MYIGDLQTHAAAHNVVHELVANSISEFLQGHVANISVEIDGLHIIVTDDGSGLNFDKKWQFDSDISEGEACLQSPYFFYSPLNAEPNEYITLQGVGLAAINALCRSLRAEADNGVTNWYCEYKRGRKSIDPVKLPSTGHCYSKIALNLESSFFVHGPNLCELKSEIRDRSQAFEGLQISVNGNLIKK